ncbi:MAG TPA: FGGY family carbohydrate kinase [Reyranella sp.]
MFLGLDIGTSGVKAVVVDEHDRVVAQAAAPLAVSRPQPLWAEQDPEEWWQAVTTALDALAAEAPRAMAAVQAIGLSGQMLGVALLDAADRPIRPALLWNDGRASAECAALERRFPLSPTRLAAVRCPASRRPSCCGSPITNRRRSPKRGACC